LNDLTRELNTYEIANLEELLKDFEFNIFNDHYSFLYENVEIIVSKKGVLSISLISTSDVHENIFLLAKIANKINKRISNKNFSEEINIYVPKNIKENNHSC
jgi:hypothetical protein